MKIHYFQHVPFEGLGAIEEWARLQQHSLTSTHFYRNDPLPELTHIDALIIMGGPMGAYEENKFNWLTKEKKFIEAAIVQKKKLMGICLGAQLIADVLGARVYPHNKKEIGWWPVRTTDVAKKHPAFSFLPPQWITFHWHGDTFDLPRGALHLLCNDVCSNQAFSYNGDVIGLQFHFETTTESLQAMVTPGEPELMEKAPYIQSAEEILQQKEHIGVNHHYLFQMLDQWQAL